MFIARGIGKSGGLANGSTSASKVEPVKILLCSQYQGGSPLARRGKICFPLGLAYIASMLEDHEVRIFDANVAENPMEELRSALDEVKPDLVGVCLRNIDTILWPRVYSFYDPFVSMTKLIKERAPSSKLVVGGTGFAIFPREIMERNREIDYGVVSHGEVTILNLVKNIDHPERTKNVVFRRKEKIVFTGRENFSDFDRLPPPLRSGFDMSKYREKTFSVGVQSKRGCAFRCAYCLDPYLGGHRLQLRSPAKVAEEIEELVNEYGIREFMFVDSIFNFPLDHARRICQEIIRRKLDVTWNAYFREDFLNAKFIQEAVRAGCYDFELHSDGACNKALTLLRKNLTMMDVERSIDLISKTENANFGTNFMYDLPGANVENFLGLTRTIGKILHKCRDKVVCLQLTRMRIYPHTLLHRIALSEHKISENTDLLRPVYYKSYSSMVQSLYFVLVDKLATELYENNAARVQLKRIQNRYG